MTEAVFQFKAINRRLNRQEQKAEFEEKNPTSELPSAYARACSAAVPFELPDLRGRVVSLTGGSCESVTLTTAQLPPYTPSAGITNIAPSEQTPFKAMIYRVKI
jgi:hypothetical protein